MKAGIHQFDNGVRVYKKQLLDLQIERYKTHNVHEAEEEDVFLDALKQVGKNAVYINIGAAIGYYPLLARRQRDDIEIIAYEPLRKHRRYFRQNIRLNAFRRSDFTIHNEGVFSRACYVNFVVRHYGSMIRENDSHQGLLRRIADIVANKRIRCLTLDDVCSRVRRNIDLIQMDIQGLEKIVLRSSQDLLSKRTVKQYLIGTHSKEIHEYCRGLLEQNGYMIEFDLYETSLQPDGILKAMRTHA